jgi:hypothetical protein
MEIKKENQALCKASSSGKRKNKNAFGMKRSTSYE